MDRIRSTLVGTATLSFLGITTVSTCLALSLRPNFVPLVVLLSTLINYTRATIQRPQFTHRFFALLSTLSVATVAAYSGPTNSAISTQFLPSGWLLVVSAVISAIALAPIMTYAKTRSYVGSRSPLAGILLFPTLWTTTWSLFVFISPLGRIGSWTPMTGVEAYSWIAPVFGQAGIDYITALWAAIVAEYAGQWLMGPEAHEQLPENAEPNVDLLTPINNEVEAEANGANGQRATHRNPTHYLLGLLLLATLPSYETPILPLSAHSQSATELTVGCVHPYVKIPGTSPSLSEYIVETRIQAPRAKILLWPEGAVKFQSDAERRHAFDEVSAIANQSKTWIGVGYEQEYSENGGTVRGKKVRGHNGLAIVGPNTITIQYVKRRLVPRKCVHLRYWAQILTRYCSRRVFLF